MAIKINDYLSSIEELRDIDNRLREKAVKVYAMQQTISCLNDRCDYRYGYEKRLEGEQTDLNNLMRAYDRACGEVIDIYKRLSSAEKLVSLHDTFSTSPIAVIEDAIKDFLKSSNN